MIPRSRALLATLFVAVLLLGGCTDLNTPVAPERVLQLTISLPSLPSLPAAVERPGDLLDGLLDGLIDGRPIGGGASPILSQPEWAWADATLLQPVDPSPDDARPISYLYVRESGGAPTPLPVSNTLNSVIMESAARFGWTSSARWWQDSRGHGYCAPSADNFFFRSIFHPQDSGYEAEARGLLAEAERLGVISAAR